MSNFRWSPASTLLGEIPQVKGDPLSCDYCGEEVEFGTESVEVLHGIAGHGKKSGRPMVVEDSRLPYPYSRLHLWCVVPFVRKSIYSDAEEEKEARFCSGCEAKLCGDD